MLYAGCGRLSPDQAPLGLPGRAGSRCSSQEEEHRSGAGGERQEGAGCSLAAPHQRTQGPKKGAVPGRVRGSKTVVKTVPCLYLCCHSVAGTLVSLKIKFQNEIKGKTKFHLLPLHIGHLPYPGTFPDHSPSTPTC